MNTDEMLAWSLYLQEEVHTLTMQTGPKTEHNSFFAKIIRLRKALGSVIMSQD